MNRHDRRKLVKLHPDHKKDELIKRMQSIIEAQRTMISRYEQELQRLAAPHA